MTSDQRMSVLILVKAAPVLTSRLRETMCVAAMTLGPSPEWIRLHPVSFRDLADETKFKKYQEVTLDATRPRADRRPESWVPLDGTVKTGGFIGTDYAWAARRQKVATLGEMTMCELVERNKKSGSGLGVPSLAVVRPAGPPALDITKRDEEQLRKWSERAEAIAAQQTLFDNSTTSKAQFEIVPWRFRYFYRCLAQRCNGHKQTIVDWEAVSLWRKVKHRGNWEDLMRQKFVDQLWGSSRDTVLFVGNMEQRPWNFLILGIFWPPNDDLQGSLF